MIEPNEALNKPSCVEITVFPINDLMVKKKVTTRIDVIAKS